MSEGTTYRKELKEMKYELIHGVAHKEAEVGDKITCMGITVTIGRIVYQEHYYTGDGDWWNIEFWDTDNNYRSWKSGVDGGCIRGKKVSKKDFVLGYVAQMLMAADCDVERVGWDERRELIIIYFVGGGERTINVCADSHIAMVADIIKQGHLM